MDCARSPTVNRKLADPSRHRHKTYRGVLEWMAQVRSFGSCGLLGRPSKCLAKWHSSSKLQGEYFTVNRWSMFFTSPATGFNVVADVCWGVFLNSFRSLTNQNNQKQTRSYSDLIQERSEILLYQDIYKYFDRKLQRKLMTKRWIANET